MPYYPGSSGGSASSGAGGMSFNFYGPVNVQADNPVQLANAMKAVRWIEAFSLVLSGTPAVLGMGGRAFYLSKVLLPVP